MRLLKLKEEYGDKIRIDWRGFPLAPFEKEDRKVYPYAAEGWTAMAGLEDGAEFIKWNLSTYPTSSMPALEAGRCAQAQGEDAALRFHSVAMKAFFAQSRDVSQLDELLIMAEEAELDVERFKSDYEGRSQRAAIQADFSEAKNKYGITGIPSMVIDERYLMAGVRQTEEYRDVIEQLLNEGEDG